MSRPTEDVLTELLAYLEEQTYPAEYPDYDGGYRSAIDDVRDWAKTKRSGCDIDGHEWQIEPTSSDWAKGYCPKCDVTEHRPISAWEGEGRAEKR